MGRYQVLMMVIAAVGTVAPAAAVAWTVNGEDGEDDDIFIGCVYINKAYHLAACEDGVMQDLGTTTSTCPLPASGTVNGGTGLDTIEVATADVTRSCGATSYNWIHVKSGATYSLDINGGAANDTIYGGDAPGTIHGNDGDDYIEVYRSSTTAYGDASSSSAPGDHIVSFSTGSGESLYGGSGIDCLADDSGYTAVFDCGSSASDQYIDQADDTEVNCEDERFICWWP